MTQEKTVFSGDWLVPAGAVVGAVFCALSGAGLTSAVCFTEGCSITGAVKLFGLSLWWYGMIAFLALAVLGAVKKWRQGLYLSLALVAVDAFLLAWLALLAPCFTCMLAGLVFLVLLFAFQARYGKGRKLVRVLTVVWMFAFAPNLFGLALDAVEPWAIDGEYGTPTELYFSPTCGACANALAYFAPRVRLQGRRIAVFPIAHSDEDIRRVIFILHKMEEGKDFYEAYGDSLRLGPEKVAKSWLEILKVKARMFRNKIQLTRTGSFGVPVVITRGAPKIQPRPGPVKPPAAPQPGPPTDNTP